MKIQFLFLACTLLSITTRSQDATSFKPDLNRRKIRAVEIPATLRVDGILSEKEWLLPDSSSPFVMIEPFQGNRPNHQTKIRALFNRQYLYLGVFSQDSLGRKAIQSTDLKRDFSYTAHDLVAIAFDGFNDKRNAMMMATNAYGSQRDMLAFDDTYFDVDWDGLWRVRTSRTDSGWYAEFAIPWQTLRYPKSKDTIQEWGLNIIRNRRLTNELTAFSPYPRIFSLLRMDYAGLITNLRPPPPRPNIRIQPYVLAQTDRSRIGTDPKTIASSVKYGGDVKWAINPNSVLDLTFNTDFAQADADRQVNNVTRFSVFFPERRQFFLENASLFGVGLSRGVDESGGNMRIQPFFSRRIGLDNNGTPIPITAGGRFVYRSNQRNFGVLAMQQKVTGPAPGTNFLVGRFSENFGAQNRIGGLLTVRDDPSGSNIVGSVDGFFRKGESHSLSTMVSVSNSSGTGKQGMSAYAQYYFTNNQFKIWWTQSIVTKNYDPQMGFVSRQDVVATTPGIFWYYRGKRLPFRKILRAYEPSIMPEFYHQLSIGKLVERSLTLVPIWLNFQSGGFFGYIISPTYQYLPEKFEPLGISIKEGEYRYNRHIIYVSSNPAKKLNLMGMYMWGSYFGGILRSSDVNLQFAPIPHFSLTGRFNRNQFLGVGEFAESATVDLLTLEARMALNPRVQLIGFYQQNSENQGKNYNIRFSWEYAPLSFLYLVFNHREFQTLSLKTQVQDQAIAKISLLKQF